jgi:hypothetical protein
MNKARISFFALFVCALSKCKRCVFKDSLIASTAVQSRILRTDEFSVS